jgi:polyisoprenyl-teichoic acid--peptidoglycan teichoic acid transferase
MGTATESSAGKVSGSRLTAHSLQGLAALLLLVCIETACTPAPSSNPPTIVPTAEPTPATLPSVASGRAPDATSIPSQSPLDLVRLPRWSRGDVVSLLVLGIDRRGNEPPRSDTILLTTIDVARKQASVVSVPRDLLVDIPGHGQERINAAFSFGEQERSGAGPARVRDVIEQNLHLSAPHWAVVDFQCFRAAVDAVGGLYIDVPTGIVDNEYPDESFGTLQVVFDPGFQWLDGERALQYARTRHADSDFGRMRRQQAVLSALRSQLITLQRLPLLPSVVDGCHGFSSDLPLIDLVALAFTARSIPESSIHLTIIDEQMTRPAMLATGAEVLVPDWQAIRPLLRTALPAMAKG